MTKAQFVDKLKYRDQLRALRDELTSSPERSASVSAGGGSQSFSKMDLKEVMSELRRVEAELDAVSTSAGMQVNYARWC